VRCSSKYSSNNFVEEAWVDAGGALVKAFTYTNAFDGIIDDASTRSNLDRVAVKVLPQIRRLVTRPQLLPKLQMRA